MLNWPNAIFAMLVKGVTDHYIQEWRKETHPTIGIRKNNPLSLLLLQNSMAKESDKNIFNF